MIYDGPYDGPMNPGGQRGLYGLLEMGRPYGGARALDVGAGTGHGMAALAEWGFSPAGLEPSEKLAKRAGIRCPSGSVVIGKAESMPFCDRSFDLVMFQCVLSLTDVPRALAETSRVLDRGGKLLIQDLFGTASGEGCLAGCRPLGEWTCGIERRGFRITALRTLEGAVRDYLAMAAFSGAPVPDCTCPGTVRAFICCAVKNP